MNPHHIAAIDRAVVVEHDAGAFLRLGASRRRNAHVVLRSVLRCAVELRMVTAMPDLPPLPRVPRVVMAEFPHDQIDPLFAVVAPRARVAVALGIYGGTPSRPS